MSCTASCWRGRLKSRWAGNLDYVDARKQPQHLDWNSIQGATKPGPEPFARPDWLLAAPKVGDPKLRRDAVQATLLLARNLQGKQLAVALQEALDAKDAPATQKVALLCYSAIDEPNVALEMLDEERTLPALRRTSVYTLRHWMAQETRTASTRFTIPSRSVTRRWSPASSWSCCTGISATEGRRTSPQPGNG